jgi:hypothetical protein
MPEDAADRLLHMEKVEFAAEPAMVAALGLFEPEEVLIEVFWLAQAVAVDALQLSVSGSPRQ